MEYEILRQLKQSDRGTVQLVREKGGEQLFIQKILNGRYPIYETLQNCPHLYLPRLYQVVLTDSSTIITEEYIEGQPPDSAQLSEKQFLNIVRELCSVLEFLHGKGIIHRDIKPSNLILAKDGHIRLIDFDAARMYKDGLEQDTRQLGTRGYAPPEQYGFAQTDERADIYSLGVTLKQLLGSGAAKPSYKKILSKCTDPDPAKRYQSVREVKQAFLSGRRRVLLYVGMALVLTVLLGSLWKLLPSLPAAQDKDSENTELTVLPMPDDLHWVDETGIMEWGNVPDSGTGDEVEYNIRLYRMDTPDPPTSDTPWNTEYNMTGNYAEGTTSFLTNASHLLDKNGFYYFAISAVGDGVHYTDSPYAISDVFEYTGESAPSLPTPTGLAWRMVETEERGREYYATWDNLEDYEDADWFNVTVYDKDGNYVMNNCWRKSGILSAGYGGIRVRAEFLTEHGNAYRFTVQVWSSRPNEYGSSLLPDPVPEEYFSPWYYY